MILPAHCLLVSRNLVLNDLPFALESCISWADDLLGMLILLLEEELNYPFVWKEYILSYEVNQNLQWFCVVLHRPPALV